MTFDYKAFLIAPKFLLAAGSPVSAAQFTSEFEKKGLKKLTPYLYACFGDVVISTGFLKAGFNPSGNPFLSNLAGTTLKTGCIVPIEASVGVDIAGSANPALIVMFQH